MPYSLSLALVSGFLALALTPVARRIAVRLGAIDVPDARRIHTVPTPRFGGLAVALGVLATAWGARVLPGPAAELDVRPLVGLTCATLPILALGIADDLRGVSPWVKLAVQACAALTLTRFGYGVPVLTNLFGPPVALGILNVPLTMLWVMAVTNAINLIDGLDGLAAGVVIMASGALWLSARSHGDFYVMFIAALLVGACSGFLRWNFPPASVFMGDTGSQFLGLTLAAASLLENRKATAAFTLLLPLVALGIPLADAVFAFLRRAARRQHVFRADTGHVHHQLLDAGLTPRGALFVLWGLCAVFDTIAVLLSWVSHAWTALLVTTLAALAFVTIELLRILRARRGHGSPDTPSR